LTYQRGAGQDESSIVRQLKIAGEQIPDIYANAPRLRNGLDLFYYGFLQLSPERDVGDTVGLISRQVILTYCAEYDISGEQKEDFVFLVQQLDRAYIALLSKKALSNADTKTSGS
jgi:hypothetical protein